MPPRKLNVLVYAGTGTTSESVRHCLLTLRRLLYPNYAVIAVTEDTLVKEPWQATCALLVIPGGADMGYSRVLNGAGNRRIGQYVRTGGRYLGLCAGGYYGSSRCEFEVGNKDLEVVGRRELGLFRGTCRGCAFAGFQYQSEAGARAVKIAIHRDDFTSGGEADAATIVSRALDLPPTAHCYYNGGGVFVDAKSTSNVQVLASYADETDVDGSKGKGKGKGQDKGKGRAAVVYCTVGEGAAILTGPHPEFEPDNLAEQPGLAHYTELLQTLRADDATQSRVKFLQACLVKLGLELGSGSAVQPRLTALHVTTLYADEVQELMYKWDEILTKPKSGEAFVKGETDTFRVLLPDSGDSAWPGSANVKAKDTKGTESGQHQPFCAAMAMDLTDRAMRYPALGALVARVAAAGAVASVASVASVADTATVVDILGALADHEPEGDVRAPSPAPSLAGSTVDAWRSAWRAVRQRFDATLDDVYQAVGQVLIGRGDDVPVLDEAVRQEMWSALVHAWEAQRAAASNTNTITSNDDDDETMGRMMQLVDEVAGDDAADGTLKRIVVYEGGWPSRVAGFDYSLFYASLGAVRATACDAGELEWGNQLMYAKVTTSTNTLLERNARLLATLPTGFTVTATRQLAARGRGRNVWLAPEGQLILSTVINHPQSVKSVKTGVSGSASAHDHRPVVFLQYLAAMALVDAVHGYAPGLADLDVRIKWPNDVYARSAATGDEYVKLAGILSACTFQNGTYQVVLGIGLNAANARPTVSLEALSGQSIANERLLACVLVHLETHYRAFMRSGFAGALERRYCAQWLHADQEVTLEAVEGAPRARILGVSSDWGLLQAAELVPTADGRGERLSGRVWKLQSDENSFDYWKGLVRTKV